MTLKNGVGVADLETVLSVDLCNILKFGVGESDSYSNIFVHLYIPGLVEILKIDYVEDTNYLGWMKTEENFEELLGHILDHSRLHDIDDPYDHNGVALALEDNLISFDANGLPKDSLVAVEIVMTDSDLYVPTSKAVLTELGTVLSAYYLKTEIDSMSEMESIWGVSLAVLGDLHDEVTLGVGANGLALDEQELSLALASTDTTGALSDTDWNIFNNKAPTASPNFTGGIQIEGGSTIQKAMSGDLVLECDPATAGTSAAVLNAAAVGTFTKVITINLKDAAGALHKWASLALESLSEEVIVDDDVAAPSRSDETPDLVNGTVGITLTYDTDAGATKTYAAGDTITFTVNPPMGGILGYMIVGATFIDTIIA